MPAISRPIAIGLVTLAASLAACAASAQDGVTDDRAAIEALQARYMFAMDWRNAEAYRDTFAEDGALVSAAGEEEGDAIGSFLRARAPDGGDQRPARTRHSIANVVLDIDGDRARGRAYWVAVSNADDAREARLDSYGHYEDELVRENGAWRFARREIFNEMLEDRAASDVRPTAALTPPPVVGDSYADDRAAIEDLQARYVFAMDWLDADAYADTFVEDGEVRMGDRVERGREAIETVIADYRAIVRGDPDGADQELRPPAARHVVTNVVVDVDGDAARAWAYWNTLANDNPERAPEVGSYGSYADELVKIDGRWLFKSRTVYNETRADRVAPAAPPFPIQIDAGPPADGSPADDRAAIENLQARYMFALDWRDPDAYAATFAEDGEVVSAAATARGREAIRAEVVAMRESDRAAAAAAGLRPFSRRHVITNLVLDIDGDRAAGRAYWTSYNNDNPERAPYLESFGHYEDELVKVDGEWLFARRVIYNEETADRAASDDWPLAE